MQEMDMTTKLEEATNLRNNGNEKEAITVYTDLRNQYKELGELNKAAFMAQEIGVCHIIMAQKSEGIEWYEKALEEFTSEGDMVAVGNVQRDIGLAYGFDEEYTRANDWLQKSCVTLQAQEDYDALGITLVKMGMIRYHLKRPDEAYRNIIEGLKVIRASSNRNWFFEMTGLLELGRVLIKENDYWRAISCFREGLQIIDEEDSTSVQRRRIGELYMSLAYAYLQIPDTDRAVNRFMKAIEAWKEMDTETKELVIRLSDASQFLELIATIDTSRAEKCQEALDAI